MARSRAMRGRGGANPIFLPGMFTLIFGIPILLCGVMLRIMFNSESDNKSLSLVLMGFGGLLVLFGAIYLPLVYKLKISKQQNAAVNPDMTRHVNGTESDLYHSGQTQDAPYGAHTALWVR